MSIERWDVGEYPDSDMETDPEGRWVRYEDHVAALQAERERIRAAVKAFIDAELATSSDKALYYFELDEPDEEGVVTGHDVTFRLDKLFDVITHYGVRP